MSVDSSSSSMSSSPTGRNYFSVMDAMRLVPDSFSGEDKRRLKEFISNVDDAFELVHPSQHDIFLKFVKAKITGDARSKLLVRELTNTWELVKGILEENYGTKRTVDYYILQLSQAKQEKGESIASWGSRIDSMQTEFREAAKAICSNEGLIGIMELSGFLAKSFFVKGLFDKTIKAAVRSKGNVLLSTAIDAALEEESAICSEELNKPRVDAPRCQNCKKVGHTSARCFLKNNNSSNGNNGYQRHGGANVNVITCYGCGKTGHLARECSKKCSKCGKAHMSKECRVLTNSSKSSNDNSNRNGNGNGNVSYRGSKGSMYNQGN